VAFKSLIAARAAALLAWSAVDRGDRVGGLVFDESRHFERGPAARTRGLLPLLKALSEDPLPGEDGGHPSLSAAAEHLTHLVRPGSLVFLISDFTGLTDVDGTWLARLGAGSEMVLVQVYDPLEAAPPPTGRCAVTDGRRRSLVDTGAEAQRAAWYQRYSGRISLLERLSLLHHAHLISLGTQQPVGETLTQGLMPRRLRTGGIR